MAEHWLNVTDLGQLNLLNYKCASFYSRLTRLHGGVAIFVHNDVKYKEINNFKEVLVEMVCEVAAIELTKEKVIFLSLYFLGIKE